MQQEKYYMKKQAKSWFDSAYYDLQLIKEILDNTELTHMVAFHAQQVIEKCFKAILEQNNEKVPRIHNIIVLRDLTEKYFDIDINNDLIDQLNELYTESRYPTDFGLLPDGKPSNKTAKEFYQCAKEVYDYLVDKLS